MKQKMEAIFMEEIQQFMTSLTKIIKTRPLN